MERERVQIGPTAWVGELERVPHCLGVTLIAHGSGNSHRHLRRRVADVLHSHRLCTLLFEFLSRSDGSEPSATPDNGALAPRVREALDWLLARPDLARLHVGLFALGTGTAAVLLAAAEHPGRVAAVVCSGGRPDVAAIPLGGMLTPTLIIVGGRDAEALGPQRDAMRQLRCSKRLEIVPGATRSFEQPGTLEAAAHLAGAWFATHLPDGAVR